MDGKTKTKIKAGRMANKSDTISQVTRIIKNLSGFEREPLRFKLDNDGTNQPRSNAGVMPRLLGVTVIPGTTCCNAVVQYKELYDTRQHELSYVYICCTLKLIIRLHFPLLSSLCMGLTRDNTNNTVVIPGMWYQVQQ